MAEWRARGYVVDSDEEDDFQNTNSSTSTCQNAASNSDDTGDVVIDQDRKGEADSEEQTVETSGNVNGHNGQAKIDCDHERKQDDAGPGAVAKAGKAQYGRLSDIEDIDELQQDHYKATASTQLQSELAQGLREYASQRQKDLSSPNHGRPSLSPSASPLLDGSSTMQGQTRSIQVLFPTLDAQGGLADNSLDGGSENSNIGRSTSQEILARSYSMHEVIEPNRGTRNLRHRNPIQLHPYQIESEKYRQILRARGVKPLRIAHMEAEAASARVDESQNNAYDIEESQNNNMEGDLEEGGSSSPLRTQGSSTDSAMNARDIFVFGDDELPDMNALLSNPMRKYVGSGFKRRKVTAPSFKIPRRRYTDELPSKNNSRASPLQEEEVIFDVPPSPPHSGSQTPLESFRSAKPRFQHPRKISSPTLPTPVTSSEPSRRTFVDVSEDEESDYSSYTRTRHSVATFGSSGVSSGNESSQEMQRVQRRIRGVLPASWLKLDLKTQSKRSGKIAEGRAVPSSEKGEVQRGVARPVRPGGGKSPDLSKTPYQPIWFSEEESSVSEDDRVHSLLNNRPDHTFHDDDDENFMTNRLGEAMEDDRIDTMLPSTARPRARPRKEKKRQTKIRDLGSQTHAVSEGFTKMPRSQRRRQQTTIERLDKGHRMKPVFHPPRLSILDATAMRRDTPTPVPIFLKVASRTARSRRDKGRHSPSQKYLRLATKDDDYDTNNTLRNWREGTIAPAPDDQIDATAFRKPLCSRSANSALPPTFPNSPKVTEDLRRPLSRSSHPRQQIRSAGTRKLQTSLYHLVEREGRPMSADNSEVARTQRPAATLKKRGQILSTLRANDNSRPAMLQSQRREEDGAGAQLVFERDLSRINRFDDGSGLPNVLRLFEEEVKLAAASKQANVTHANEPMRVTKAQTSARKPVPHRDRKRRPRQVDISVPWFTQPNALISIDSFPDEISIARSGTGSRNALTGLGSFGTRYSDTFDIVPLPTGTCFHGSTILGSGIFAKSLQLAGSSMLDDPRGFAVWTHENRTFRWGPWNDAVSSELGHVMTFISQAVPDVIGREQRTGGTSSERAISMLQEVVRYISDHLSFFDCVDRISFVQRCKDLVYAFHEAMGHDPHNNTTVSRTLVDSSMTSRILAATLGLVLFNQLRQIATHKLVPRPLQDEVCLLTRKAVRQTLNQALKGGFGAISTCLSQFRQSNCNNYMIGEAENIAQAIVVVQHVIGQDSDGKTNACVVSQIDVPMKPSNGPFDIQVVERSWEHLFTLLPFSEFDTEGTLETGRRFKVAFDNWTLVKSMISPVLVASLRSPRGQSPSFNAYCRALFGRCLHLINGWGWRRCEAIIGTLFDFFARNNLAHLKNEAGHGSPQFLEQLDADPSLAVEADDRCFHILLKIIASGVRHMRRTYPEKKIRDLIWRLMPNHGRFHPKEKPIRQEDLDALRNHHDLLCTLYWASPPSCRPRLTVIRNLVQLETSHREACHINIRAWFKLVKFQLSTEEPHLSLKLFTGWQDDLLGQILRQHALARTEAEAQVISAHHSEGLTVSKDILETTIARNQRQVEAMLIDTLVCVKLAIEAARNEKAAAVLMSTSLAKVFELFDARRPQLNKVIVQALEVVSVYVTKSTTQQLDARDQNDDSQDYGDWPAMDEDVNGMIQVIEESITSPLQHFQEPLRHLLSNCFGSDVVPDDSLMLTLVDVWIAVAQVLVRRGDKSWTDYIDRFGHDSWSSLRDTEQTRKYAAFFLAGLVEKDNNVFVEHRTFFFMSWIGSLVERESLLKYQYRLTEALLNADPNSLIAKNLPFWADTTTGRFQLTAAEFSQRRLSVISSVLSNMRVASEQAVFDPLVDATRLRQEYKDLLKHLMATMRNNYQELGHGSNVRGNYVDFVHRVVEFLQQHTSNICPVDRFFTDNDAFPLPATDPTYVVGQLKNYALRLYDPGTPKQLAVFLQSVSERAAIDGQQSYLVGQLHAAMSNAFEDGAPTRRTLRSILVKAIMPAYIDLALENHSGWILALPYLQALRNVFGELLMDLDGTNVDSVAAVASTVTVFLDTVRQSFGILLQPSNLFEFPWISKTLSAFYEAITALLPVLDYLVRLSGPTQRAVKDISFLRSFAVYTAAVLSNPSDKDLDVSPPVRDDVEDPMYADIRVFATQELKDTLVKNWTNHGMHWYISRGSNGREVVVDIGLKEEEQQHLYKVLDDFLICLNSMPALGDERDRDYAFERRPRLPVNGMDMLVI
ncbi:hypothetical protein N7G274_000941 [Stereocaulon virgatum]|uniref:Uncharacterized protein n=1 Tax=Stereocaulon virgatum TaxID=373712 RepID=A0ABR4AP82_9LECA